MIYRPRNTVVSGAYIKCIKASNEIGLRLLSSAWYIKLLDSKYSTCIPRVGILPLIVPQIFEQEKEAIAQIWGHS